MDYTQLQKKKCCFSCKHWIGWFKNPGWEGNCFKKNQIKAKPDNLCKRGVEK